MTNSIILALVVRLGLQALLGKRDVNKPFSFVELMYYLSIYLYLYIYMRVRVRACVRVA